MKLVSASIVLCLLASLPNTVLAQALEQRLLEENPENLARVARALGDPKRGAVLFYQPYMACTKCHTVGARDYGLGPNLAKLPEEVTDLHIVESILDPSKKIRKGFESVTVITLDGRTVVGLPVPNDNGQIAVRDATQPGRIIEIAKEDIDEVVNNTQSIMPAGQVNQLASRQQVLDLMRYVMEVVEFGPSRARELEPPAALYAAKPLPEYESHIDHAGMIRDLDDDSYDRGEAIYNRLCINCHGTHTRPGSLPTSLRFASGKFKNGNDPHTMYQTLTRGFGMMVAQAWMVPQQKYDVIHYIREAYLKDDNPSQYARIDASYLERLPKGDTRGPEPTNIEPWVNMDYGPNLVNTYEIGTDASNFAYKGIAVRLDPGPGGVSRGQHWMVFDHDTMRVAAAWSGTGFIDWNGIHFNGRHQIHPRVVGDVKFSNPTGPGWAEPSSTTFEDPRLRGRDDRLYGPLPRDWSHYKGMYYYNDRVIISYTVGDSSVLESPGLLNTEHAPVFTRSLNIGPRSRDMILQVAHHPEDEPQLVAVDSESAGQAIVTVVGDTRSPKDQTAAEKLFNGTTSVEVDGSQVFDMTKSDYSITARIRTDSGGTLFSKAAKSGEWVRDGKTLFVRGGKLCFDIGWVGAVRSRRSVNDGQWHDVAMTWQEESGEVQLFIDGKLEGSSRLSPKRQARRHVVRIGYTAPDFPEPQSYFDGEIDQLRFYARQLNAAELAPSNGNFPNDATAIWDLARVEADTVADVSGNGHSGSIVRSRPLSRDIAAGIRFAPENVKWLPLEEGNLRLKIPAGPDPINFLLWTAGMPPGSDFMAVAGDVEKQIGHFEATDLDLEPLTHGGPPRWPTKVTTAPIVGNDDGPFAVDVLTRPEDNPWLCQVRLTGIDFFPDGNEAILSAWDGDIWHVTGLNNAAAGLTWQRIASGLFQPLGVKIVDGEIYITCRDQLVILHDLNDDGEIDYFENFNNDHQVTDHFHEFAMGLQTDDQGNFYYAKSARHALPALVPHHGTLLRVSPDGERTDILANGFRAANGVCLNPDGTFIVTDQEGHWNPKNRINWVQEGGFYGNMFGYHDVTDDSDDAMEQPLCWITNEFDRSPAELLWVDSDQWGPISGSLLNLSYGYGKVYVVPHERVNGQVQGGMCELPIPQFPTGVIRGRFHPVDGQLYTCGMFAWAGSQHQPGGFYRIRYTGKPVHLPIGLHAKTNGMEIEFSGELDPASAGDLQNFAVKVWSLKRTANYGSKHYDEHALQVASAELSDDRKTLFLEMPEIEPTWCMEIRYFVTGSNGEPIEGVIHNTVHNLSR